MYRSYISSVVVCLLSITLLLILLSYKSVNINAKAIIVCNMNDFSRFDVLLCFDALMAECRENNGFVGKFAAVMKYEHSRSG